MTRRRPRTPTEDLAWFEAETRAATARIARAFSSQFLQACVKDFESRPPPVEERKVPSKVPGAARPSLFRRKRG